MSPKVKWITYVSKTLTDAGAPCHRGTSDASVAPRGHPHDDMARGRRGQKDRAEPVIVAAQRHPGDGELFPRGACAREHYRDSGDDARRVTPREQRGGDVRERVRFQAGDDSAIQARPPTGA